MHLTVTLPGGVWHGGQRSCEAELRSLDGRDELLLASGHQLPVHRATMLLARCVTRIGDIRNPDGVGPEAVRDLTVGDRDALLLQLRRITFGDRLACLLTCSGCGERLTVRLRVDDLMVPMYVDGRPEGKVRVELGDTWFEVTYRLPTGRDQEAAAAAGSIEGSAQRLLERCVRAVVDDRMQPASLPRDALAGAVAEAMAQQDPQADLVLRADCPGCGRSVEALLDAGSYLFREVAQRAVEIRQDVHLLAYHYHWSHAEILALPPAERRELADLIMEERRSAS